MIKFLFAFLMGLVCTTTGCIAENEPSGPSVAVGDELPQFSVVLNNGDLVSTQTLQGKTSVIVFFNTDCSDCREELPVIQQLWNNYNGESTVCITLIAREETEDQILKYWDENNFSMPFSPQETREVYNLFATSVIPRIYIANPLGIITAAYGDTDMPSYTDLVNKIFDSQNNPDLL